MQINRTTNEPHDRNRTTEARAVRASDPRWLTEATQSIAADLRAFAARYPGRFEYRDGKLVQIRRA
jgi:hypothetical protein